MTGTTTTYAVSATGTVSLVGVDGVTLGGTVAVRWNDTGAAVHRTATFEGGWPTRSRSTSSPGSTRSP